MEFLIAVFFVIITMMIAPFFHLVYLALSPTAMRKHMERKYETAQAE